MSFPDIHKKAPGHETIAMLTPWFCGCFSGSVTSVAPAPRLKGTSYTEVCVMKTMKPQLRQEEVTVTLTGNGRYKMDDGQGGVRTGALLRLHPCPMTL